MQCDEIWSFCYAKKADVPEEGQGEFGVGDVWTLSAMDADAKLAVSWLADDRNAGTAFDFMQDVADRLNRKVQLTTDGHKANLDAVDAAFGGNIDYAMLIKLYGPAPEGERRYNPPVCTDTETRVISDNQVETHISTSYIERENLTLRMAMRRFTRLTNAFFKEVENLAHAVGLYSLNYYFARPHASLKGQTPAMSAGLAGHVWDVKGLAR